MDFLVRRRVSLLSAIPGVAPLRCAFGDARWVSWSRETWLQEPCQYRQAELKFSLVAVLAKGLKMLDADHHIISRQNKRPLDRVLQLAHVPRPLRFLQETQRFRRQLFARHGILVTKLLQKMFRQRPNIRVTTRDDPGFFVGSVA